MNNASSSRTQTSKTPIYFPGIGNIELDVDRNGNIVIREVALRMLALRSVEAVDESQQSSYEDGYKDGLLEAERDDAVKVKRLIDASYKAGYEQGVQDHTDDVAGAL